MIGKQIPIILIVILLACGCVKRQIGTGKPATRDYQLKEKSPFTQKELDIIVNLDALEKKWEQGFGSGLVKEQNDITQDIKDIALDNLPLLKKAMQTNDIEVKMIASLALGFTDEREVVDMLLAATNDASNNVKANAAFSIGLLGFKDISKESLVSLLSSEDPAVRNSAAFALSRTVSKTDSRLLLEPLHKALKDAYPEVRREVVRSLTILADKESMSHLINCLKDTDEFVRINAVLALSFYKDASVIKSLIEALSDTEQKVRDAALYSLKQITGESFSDAKPWQDWWAVNKDSEKYKNK